MKLYFRQENEPPHLQILTYFLVLHQDYKQLDSIVGWGPAYQTNLLCRCWSLQLTEYQTNCNAFDIFYLLFEVPKCVLNVCILCAF